MNTLVIGASGGIGSALVQALRARGDTVTALSRAEDGFDITDEDNIQTQLSRFDAPFDLVIVATGILAAEAGPEKTIRNLTAAEMQHLFAVNTIGPALVLKHLRPLLPRKTAAKVAVLSARVGSIGDNTLGGWYSYRASKAALNQVIKTAAIELARTHKHLTCVALHPGTVATQFSSAYLCHKNVPPAKAAGNLLGVIDGLTPNDSGAFYDWAAKPVPW
ncbi:SDR family NAD(P)-dependent oxidoreductase [Epibacterium sp. SM1969]|uniref:SDR family NAD(P)-dependent oxidoreductase n=1 Tax=Tritonibacter aquimaris TaxID=2663379 RepID=A0A844AVC3_9RHOB|nr:SDR family NAD(P)-dependent oxidoreductase [Tritonibacter aquimaris]MQY43418.1 SDR family NAD(P)-dependent oxidoreductase [Tritonibacter aquimaris]